MPKKAAKKASVQITHVGPEPTGRESAVTVIGDLFKDYPQLQKATVAEALKQIKTILAERHADNPKTAEKWRTSLVKGSTCEEVIKELLVKYNKPK